MLNEATMLGMVDLECLNLIADFCRNALSIGKFFFSWVDNVFVERTFIVEIYITMYRL